MIKHREGDANDDAADQRHRLFRYSPEINSGTIVQIGVILVGMALGYSKIETSIALSNQRADTIEQRAADQKQSTNAALAELKADVKDTGQKVTDLKTKIDLIDLKISQPRK